MHRYDESPLIDKILYDTRDIRETWPEVKQIEHTEPIPFVEPPDRPGFNEDYWKDNEKAICQLIDQDLQKRKLKYSY